MTQNEFNISKPARHFTYHSFSIYKFYMVITIRVCVLRTNSDFCLIQH